MPTFALVLWFLIFPPNLLPAWAVEISHAATRSASCERFLEELKGLAQENADAKKSFAENRDFMPVERGKARSKVIGFRHRVLERFRVWNRGSHPSYLINDDSLGLANWYARSGRADLEVDPAENKDKSPERAQETQELTARAVKAVRDWVAQYKGYRAQINDQFDHLFELRAQRLALEVQLREDLDPDQPRELFWPELKVEAPNAPPQLILGVYRVSNRTDIEVKLGKVKDDYSKATNSWIRKGQPQALDPRLRSQALLKRRLELVLDRIAFHEAQSRSRLKMLFADPAKGPPPEPLLADRYILAAEIKTLLGDEDLRPEIRNVERLQWRMFFTELKDSLRTLKKKEAVRKYIQQPYAFLTEAEKADLGVFSPSHILSKLKLGITFFLVTTITGGSLAYDPMDFIQSAGQKHEAIARSKTEVEFNEALHEYVKKKYPLEYLRIVKDGTERIETTSDGPSLKGLEPFYEEMVDIRLRRKKFLEFQERDTRFRGRYERLFKQVDELMSRLELATQGDDQAFGRAVAELIEKRYPNDAQWLKAAAQNYLNQPDVSSQAIARLPELERLSSPLYVDVIDLLLVRREYKRAVAEGRDPQEVLRNLTVERLKSRLQHEP